MPESSPFRLSPIRGSLRENLTLPHSRPMPLIGRRCHEVRINDADISWRIIYRIDPDAIVVLEVFSKKSDTTPKRVINVCRERLRRYDHEKG